MDVRDLRDLVAFSPEGPVHRAVAESANLWAELVCVEGAQQIGPIGDRDSDALCTVVAGRIVVQVGRDRSRLGQWEAVVVPAGSTLTITNAGEEPSVVLLVAAPPPTRRAVDG
ncbi:MAG: cupin domain-containing protein [Actinomycetota bacterium]